MNYKVEEFKNNKFEHNDTIIFYDAKVYYNNDKPCAIALKESEGKQNPQYNEVKDILMESAANGITKLHNAKKTENPIENGNKIYVYADNGNNAYKERTFEFEVKGKYPNPVQEKIVEKRSSNIVHKDEMEVRVSQLQGKDLSDYNTHSMKPPTQSR